MRKRKRFFLLVVLLLGTSLFFGWSHCDRRKTEISEFYSEIELFADAISILRMNYVDPVKPKSLVYGALKGMLASLDDYSRFLEPTGYKEIKEDTKGEFGGLGIEIGIREGMLTVISPIDGTPAAKAGLMPKDVIVKIDGEITKDIIIRDAVRKLRGKPGSSVDLTIWREKERKFLDITIVRAIIEVRSIRKSHVLDGRIGYVKLIEFQENSAKDLEQALKDMKAEKLNGLILDLRYNAGGLLNSAIQVSDLFLKKGAPIVSTKGRTKAQSKQFNSAKDTPYTEITIAVLVNEGSASASEIVAGAIKYNQRGILVGEKTFGKGSVQTVIPLKDGSALRLTTAEYFAPGGHSIRKKGIIPDIVVEFERKNISKEKSRDKEFFEKMEKEEKNNKPDFVIDNQIKTAMNLIKAINISKGIVEID